MLRRLQWPGITPLRRHLLPIITGGGDGHSFLAFPFTMEGHTTTAGITGTGIALTTAMAVGIADKKEEQWGGSTRACWGPLITCQGHNLQAGKRVLQPLLP